MSDGEHLLEEIARNEDLSRGELSASCSSEENTDETKLRKGVDRPEQSAS